MNIQAWLNEAIACLQSESIASARLDALLLVSDELNQNKAQVLAHPEETLQPNQLESLETKLARRLSYEPMAYIRGRQEFFGRVFAVSPDVLIPRPETEMIIEILRNLPNRDSARLIDIGTGSGCVAITAKLEFPAIEVYATDISNQALEVARKNAESLGANVIFKQQDLFAGEIYGPFDCIAANLPYVDASWNRSPETSFEPEQALFATDSGLALIKKLIVDSPAHLKSNGYLLLEADTRQHQAIIQFARNIYKLVRQQGLIILLQKTDKILQI